MTLAVKVALNPNTTNQPILIQAIFKKILGEGTLLKFCSIVFGENEKKCHRRNTLVNRLNILI